MLEFDEMSGLELEYAQAELHKHFVLEEMVSLCGQYGYEEIMADFRNRLNEAIDRLVPVVDSEV
jgi:hypothetical protein